MACDFPLKAFRSETVSPAGKRLLTFNPLHAVNSTSPFEIPCGRCMGCKLDKAHQWAVRILHESKMHPENCFLTLTYSNDHVPTNYGLDLRHLQLFIKRLRKSLPQRVRFYACGEYGDDLLRPHYHAIIFNHDFHDKTIYSYNHLKQPIFNSERLTNLWQLGHATTQYVDYGSASYVARYTTKKYVGDEADKHYSRISPIDGQPYQVKPEFSVMSRRPGIGTTWFDQYRSDLYPSGFVIVDGQKRPIPRFYKLKLEEEEQEKLKRAARRNSLKHKADNTMERRLARAAVRDARISTLKRNLK